MVHENIFFGLHMFIFSMGCPLHVFALQMSSSYKQLDGSTASLYQILGKNVWLQTDGSNVVAAIRYQSIRGFIFTFCSCNTVLKNLFLLCLSQQEAGSAGGQPASNKADGGD